MELRIARAARERYGFEETLFSTNGDAMLLEPSHARRLAARMAPDDSERRERIAAEVLAIGLIHELGHRAVAVERRVDPRAGGPVARALSVAERRLSQVVVTEGLAAFASAFPAAPVYRGEEPAAAWLQQPRGTVPGREATLEELTLTWVALQNPAVGPYRELMDDTPLSGTPYPRLVGAITGADLPAEEPDPDRAAPARRLIERLLEPSRAAPQSLAAQLRWIRDHWAGWLDESDLAEIDRHRLDLEARERAAFLRHRRTTGAADSAHPPAREGFRGLGEEPEAFSEDRDWMAELVLIAKSTYVWLAQLSGAHGRDISRLDQIPDEELDELRARGFTGLWLIGIWERSPASRSIKQRRGNADALASAYSVADYRIADELGGEEAWRNLQERARARGMRLAADMVPNHMGIDSRWVVEHPERFIWSPYPPFEAYSFGGPDLSSDGRVAIALEDHYWDSSDAAVVFRRVDRASGETRYLYHGNDGTSFPWNDTAQLDFLKPDVREAVIGQILDVARRFPVIRFDAAMVLARKHIQRLWYPLPGQEAGIPSRSAAALTAEEFLRRMPAEFWREVVDRVASEAPDTLLLAEAFWLMEGFFVRTLGMHRVYNSAFMHMLRDEKNAEYQTVIRETISFDARILGRYVNFMNNPDERSAIDQFGSHDKYFGVTTLLATLPGLPMFGHGQVEGHAEQYGMEFRRPMRDEPPDAGLIARHRREIAPLLQQRWRFAAASGFRQLVAVDGVAEVPDVFAFTNRAEAGPPDATERRSLVVYLNRFQRAHVRIRGVAEALGLAVDAVGYVILHDHRSGLQYLRAAGDLREHGLELSLDGYRCHVFLAFEEVEGEAWAELAWRLGLDGVADAHLALRRLREEPLRAAVAGVFASVEADPGAGPGADLAAALDRLRLAAGSGVVVDGVAARTRGMAARLAKVQPPRVRAAVGGWVLAQAIGEVACDGDEAWTAEAFDAWDGATVLGERLRHQGVRDADGWRSVELTRALLRVSEGALTEAGAGAGLPTGWFDADAVAAAAGWNEWQGQPYLSREAWDELLDALAARDSLPTGSDALPAALELKRRAAALGYRLTEGSSAPDASGQESGADAGVRPTPDP